MQTNIDIATTPASGPYLTLTDATKILPRKNGSRIHPSTLWRWCRLGCKGIRLQYVRVGRAVMVTESGLNQFFLSLAASDFTQKSRPEHRPAIRKRHQRPQYRQAAIDDANAILVRAGILKQSIPAENGFSQAQCCR